MNITNIISFIIKNPDKDRISISGESSALKKIEDHWNKFNIYSSEDSPQIKELLGNIRSQTILKIEAVSLPARKNVNRKYAIAASFIFLLSFTFAYLLINGKGVTEQSTLPGERSIVFLPDGSKVTLNSESAISYTTNFNGGVREITLLKGEAYFTVAKNKKPFIVKTGDTSTKTYASSFVIQAPEKKSGDVKVAVINGEARVEAKKTTNASDNPSKIMPLLKLLPPISMRQKEMVVYDANAQTMEKAETFDEKELYGWKDGILYFKDADCDEIKTKLSKWYGVKVDMGNACSQQDFLFSGEFINTNLDKVLSQISIASKKSPHNNPVVVN